ncbi:Protein kinase domain-containing protein [Aphelenchoides fujianensis]|nr:Protein kinase domain-containing protein [Aphelenchoides fujianensis]KAI6222287.1 Protein kinase domain-containing protein [Aphelenchoides fujianensis]
MARRVIRAEREVALTIANERLHANGVFSKVYRAELLAPLQRTVAVEKVWLSKTSVEAAEREIALPRRLRHPCVIDLLYRFRLTVGEEVCECLGCDFLPTDLSKLRLSLPGRRFDSLDAKLFAWQFFAALDHVHSLGIAHCDLKPSNLIVGPHFGLLRLADFGNAKVLGRGEECSPYQVTRYYRAPELCFGATSFTLSIDRWAAGCVLAELLVGRPLLCGRDAVDQGRVIVEVLGYPSGEQLRAMRVGRPRLVRRGGRGFEHLIAGVDFPPAALELVRALRVYEPRLRPPAALVLGHAFFDQLRHFPPPQRPPRPATPLLDQRAGGSPFFRLTARPAEDPIRALGPAPQPQEPRRRPEREHAHPLDVVCTNKLLFVISLFFQLRRFIEM